MTSFRRHHTIVGADLTEGERSAEWDWGAVHGRWSVAQALSVLAGVSLTIWTTVLVALLT